MATYYKYQERDPGSEINWAEVGSNFSGMLQEEARTRTAKKQAIDDSTREQQRVLDNAVQGDSTNMNQWTLDYAANATEQMMMTNRLMKSGDLSMKDFTMMRQNLADGTDQAFTLSQEYQTEYADKMARADCKDPSGVGCSQQLELDIMASAEGFGNFNKSQLVIDPQTGKVNVGFYKKDDKGVMVLDSDPNSLVGINNLRNRIKGKIELYDMKGAVANAVESFGEYETITRKIGSLNAKGLLLNISDPTLRGKEIKNAVTMGQISQADADLMVGWEEVLDAKLEGELSNPFTVSSLLTNNLGQINGKSYTFEWDEKIAKADKTGTVILLKNIDGQVVPDWTTVNGKKQREEAKKGLRTVMLGAIDHKVKTTTVGDSPGWEPKDVRDDGKKDDATDNKVSKIGDLWGGNNQSINGATTYFRDQNESIQDVTRNEDGIEVTYTNKAGETESRAISFYVMKDNPDYDSTQETSATNPLEIRDLIDDGNGNMVEQRLTQEEFIEAAGPLLTGESDVSESLKRGRYEKDAEFNKDGSSKASVTKEEKLDYTTEKDLWLEESSARINFNRADDVKFAEQVEAEYKDLGLVAVSQGSMSNIVQLTIPGSGLDPVTIDTNNYTADGAEAERQKLMKFIKLATAKDTSKLAKRLNWKGEVKDEYGN